MLAEAALTDDTMMYRTAVVQQANIVFFEYHLQLIELLEYQWCRE